jgi:hypothetical protein
MRYYIPEDNIPHEVSSLEIVLFMGLIASRAEEAVDLLPLVSVEATRVSIPTGNSETLLDTPYSSSDRAWSDVNILEI